MRRRVGVELDTDGQLPDPGEPARGRPRDEHVVVGARVTTAQLDRVAVERQPEARLFVLEQDSFLVRALLHLVRQRVVVPAFSED